MSEYQYYEFRTVDRSLTAGEIAELEKLSSRAEITATSFTNTYSYGRRTSTCWRSRNLPTCATLRHEIGRSSSSRPACLTLSGGTPRSPLFSNDSGRPV